MANEPDPITRAPAIATRGNPGAMKLPTISPTYPPVTVVPSSTKETIIFLAQ